MFDAEHKQRSSPVTAISFSSSALRCEQPLEGFRILRRVLDTENKPGRRECVQEFAERRDEDSPR